MFRLALDDFHFFARLATLGSLSAVARERDVPVSKISRGLDRIEAACGARLVRRSTHGMTLTAEGETFLEHCQRMLSALDALEGDFSGRNSTPRGTVRVAVSTVLAHYEVLPSLPGLYERYPEMRVDVEVSDRAADLVRDGIDIALRSAEALPDHVVAKRIGTLDRGLYAAPAYIARAGMPEHPDALAQHCLITNSAVPALNQWPFIEGERRFVVTAHGQWQASDTNVAAGMVLEGLGIGRVASVVARQMVAQGRLVPVLPTFVEARPVPMYAVTLAARYRLPKIQACLEYWAAWFSERTDHRAPSG